MRLCHIDYHVLSLWLSIMFCIKTCLGTDICGRFSDIRLVESVGRYSRLHIDGFSKPVMVTVQFDEMVRMINNYKEGNKSLPVARLTAA